MKKIFPLFAVIIVLVLAVCSFHIIPTGYTGVKTSFGQIQETTIQSGKLNFCIPFVQSIHNVSTTSSRISTSKRRSGAKPPTRPLCMPLM
ncbi:MAG: SPFH domain-containing protein [Subdoligranulum sp.]